MDNIANSRLEKPDTFTNKFDALHILRKDRSINYPYQMYVYATHVAMKLNIVTWNISMHFYVIFSIQ